MYLLETTYLGVEEPCLWMFHNTKHCDLAQTFLYQAVFISVNLLNSAYIILRLTFSFEHHKQLDVKATVLWLWHLWTPNHDWLHFRFLLHMCFIL